MMKREKLSGRKVMMFVGLGVVFWLVGALTVRLLGEAVFTAGNPLLIVFFIGAIPLMFGVVGGTFKVLKVEKRLIFEAVAIMTAAAIVLDGTVLTFYRHLYSSIYEVSHYGAAWILWGGGIGLWVGYWLSFRKRG